MSKPRYMCQEKNVVLGGTRFPSCLRVAMPFVDPDGIWRCDVHTTVPPQQAFQAPNVPLEWDPDFSDRDRIRESLELCARDLARGVLQAPRANAIAQVARVALASLPEETGAGGALPEAVARLLDLDDDVAEVVAQKRLKRAKGS